jgi:C4-type Zn-finger protein
MTNIPFFKEVVIMATLCDACGHKTNEVKSGGGIEAKGKKITLRYKSCQTKSNQNPLRDWVTTHQMDIFLQA